MAFGTRLRKGVKTDPCPGENVENLKFLEDSVSNALADPWDNPGRCAACPGKYETGGDIAATGWWVYIANW